MIFVPTLRGGAMTETGNSNRRLIVLRVGLFGASVGAIVFPSEFLPPFVAYEDLSNYRFAIREKLLITQMASWFILCAIPASCFALSLILKTYSRRALLVLIPWTAAMVPARACSALSSAGAMSRFWHMAASHSSYSTACDRSRPC